MMPEAIFAALIGLGSSFVTACVAYGITKQKVATLKEDLAGLRKDLHEIEVSIKQEHTRFVTLQHFDAVVNPLRQTMDNVQSDVKLLLRMIGNRNSK